MCKYILLPKTVHPYLILLRDNYDPTFKKIINFLSQAGIALRMFDGRVDDPFAVTPLSTWLSLAAELIICSIHPFPGNITVRTVSTVLQNCITAKLFSETH